MELRNFAILKGENVTIEKGHIKITTPKKKRTIEENEIAKEERPASEVRSDYLFRNGIIELKFMTNNHNSGILFMFNSEEENIAIGMSRTFNSFIIAKGSHRLVPISRAGNFKNYKLSEEHTMKIEISGSNARLYIDNILLCSAAVSIKETSLLVRFNSLGTLELYDIKVNNIKPKIFVVMQFSKEYNELFEDVIRPITENAGFECIRADEFYTSTPIIKDVIDSINKSTAIIAEITPDNPNVFYEIGYSHAINKPTILLCDKKREKLPFDISSFRTLFYENTIAGKRKVEESLKKYLEEIK